MRPIKTKMPNQKILKMCRKQMALTIKDVQKKAGFNTLAKIENGEKQITIKQMDKLSQIYLIPSWVFLEKTLPIEYDFNKNIPSFRRFSKSNTKDFNYQSRFLVTKVESYRRNIIDLKKEMNDRISKFNPPVNKLMSSNIMSVSKSIRDWINPDDKFFNFNLWRKSLENVGVFVFLTSSFQSWSKIDSRHFRGLSIYYDKLPIIIINNSDIYKAMSFTLLHELGHLLMKKIHLIRL